MQGKWTRAGVRHKGPRWYWVRYSDEPKGLVYAAMIIPGRVYWHCSWITWEGMERWSEPIPEPGG